MQAINSAIMKNINRKLVLNCIRRQPISRAEIANQTQLTRASITQIVDGLMQEGLVVETDIVDSHGPGRKQTQLAIVENSRLIAGAILGDHSYDLSLINLKGEVLWHHHDRIDTGNPEDTMESAMDLIRSAAEKFTGTGAQVQDMGVCLPSALSQRLGNYWRKPGTIKKTHDRIVGEIKRRLGWDCVIGSASNAYALDELYFGIGQTEENFMVLRVDESVGAGFIIQGRLFISGRGFSPEIGHITLDRNGPLCKCGNRGCLENYLAVPAVLKDTPYANWQDVIHRMDSEELAAQIFCAEGELLAFEIMNLANVMDLDRVVISGDLAFGGERLAEYINKFMDEHFVHRMGKNSVISGREANIARIAAMPAYHALFA